MLVPSLAVLALAASRVTAAPTTTPPTYGNGSIAWGSCGRNTSSHVLQCGTLKVPLDYTNTTSNKTIELQLLKVLATKKPFLGTIMYNPGGPGEPARNNTYLLKDQLLITTGGQHDIVTWDTRGSANTLPIDCYPNELEYLTFQVKNPTTSNYSDTSIATSWAYGSMHAAACAETSKDIGELIGTVATVRDMMSIVDALGGDGMLRYYGNSYGTALGATAAAMFPDKVAAMVLDGVLNPSSYWTGDGWDSEQVASNDDTVRHFANECVQSPELCALATLAPAGDLLYDLLVSLAQNLTTQPLALGSNPSLQYVDVSLLKSGMANTLYATGTNWIGLAALLESVIAENGTAFASLLSANSAPSTGRQIFPGTAKLDQAVTGVRCSDESFRATNLSEVVPIVNAWYASSYWAGSWLAAQQPLTCAHWPFSAKERYNGSWENVQTKNPLLFVANTWDPVTSIVAAQNASAAFAGSVLLQSNTSGHTSLSQPSICTATAIGAYFHNGTMPVAGTICPSSLPGFTTKSWLEPFKNKTLTNGTE